MLRVIVKIQIEQQTPKGYATKRDKKFVIDFAQNYEVVSSWKNMTDTAKIKLPKNMVIRDVSKRTFNLRDSNKPIGASLEDIPAVFMRGDKITIDHGYWGLNADGAEKRYMTGEDGIPNLFEGYITGIKTADLFEMTCEDGMWKLKQTGVANKVWKGITAKKMLEEMLAGTDYKLPAEKANRKTVLEAAKSLKGDMGTYITQNHNLGKVLEELRSREHIEAYLRGNELRVGMPVYYEEEARMHQFIFSGKHGNIISHNLEYKNEEDKVFSAVATTVKEMDGSANHRGKTKKKTQKAECLVTLQNRQFTVKTISPGEVVPKADGEVRVSLPYTSGTSEEQMIASAKELLRQQCYTGFEGHFTTFGMPFVRHGDNVQLIDPSMPERNGSYKVKAVTYKGGTSGLRQEIHLDKKLPEKTK
ncbi:MAG: hypothetical protein EOP56_08250 [Sphingobacteriales bacterium]|nr:MAG: hypothetical protein EOP56_08250 [Sphingobacteriales bacterium]